MSSAVKLSIDREAIWRVRREAKAYYHALRFGPPPAVRLLIFAQGRTGSTLLENLLASTGHFEERGEVLGANNERVAFPAAYVKGLARMQARMGARPKGVRNFQCHVKIYHLDRDRTKAGAAPMPPRDFIKTLSDDGWKIVYLRRNDKFQHYLSGLIAKARGGYHKFDGSEERLQIEIDRADLERGLGTRRELDRQEAEVLRDISHLSLVYEDDLKDAAKQVKTIAKVLDFLGLKDRPAKTRMKKINALPQEQIFTNFADAIDWAKTMDADV